MLVSKFLMRDLEQLFLMGLGWLALMQVGWLLMAQLAHLECVHWLAPKWLAEWVCMFQKRGLELL